MLTIFFTGANSIGRMPLSQQSWGSDLPSSLIWRPKHLYSVLPPKRSRRRVRRQEAVKFRGLILRREIPITLKAIFTHQLHGRGQRPSRTYDISRRVYQRNDIDWKSSQFRDKYGRTNLDRVKDGDPPLSSDGQSIQLHHVIGKEPGAMAEIPRSVHQKYSKQLHGIIEKSFRRNPTLNEMYNNYRQQYWRWRAEQVERKLK